MIQAVENYMSNHGITMTDVSKNSGISMSTLSQASEAGWILEYPDLKCFSVGHLLRPRLRSIEIQGPLSMRWSGKQTIRGYHIPGHDFWRIEAML